MRWLLAVSVMFVLAGCGDNGALSTAADEQLSEYRVVDLANGDSAWYSEEPRSTVDSSSGRYLILRRMPANRTVIGAGSAAGYVDATEQMRSTTQVRSCFIAVTECTLAQWSRLRDETPPAEEGALPISNVSRDEILATFDRFARRTGTTFDLPTQIEWEAAARWGHDGEFPFDPEQPASRAAQARVRETVLNDGPAAVAGSRQPNPLGLYDMHGNVWELVRELDHLERALARGGSWYDPVRASRITNQIELPSDVGHPLVGFRVVIRP